MPENHLWFDLWLIVQYAPALINVLTLIATVVLLLCAFIRDRQ